MDADATFRDPSHVARRGRRRVADGDTARPDGDPRDDREIRRTSYFVA